PRRARPAAGPAGSPPPPAPAGRRAAPGRMVPLARLAAALPVACACLLGWGTGGAPGAGLGEGGQEGEAGRAAADPAGHPEAPRQDNPGRSQGCRRRPEGDRRQEGWRGDRGHRWQGPANGDTGHLRRRHR
ncbi:unnamed protein product, partial [Prorocentrum cordatum]